MSDFEVSFNTFFPVKLQNPKIAISVLTSYCQRKYATLLFESDYSQRLLGKAIKVTRGNKNGENVLLEEEQQQQKQRCSLLTRVPFSKWQTGSLLHARIITIC